MGRDKALLVLGGKTLLARAGETLSFNCQRVGVGARGEGPVARLAEDLGLATVFDPPGFAEGPLVGVLAGLR